MIKTFSTLGDALSDIEREIVMDFDQDLIRVEIFITTDQRYRVGYQKVEQLELDV